MNLRNEDGGSYPLIFLAIKSGVAVLRRKIEKIYNPPLSF